MIKWLIYQDDIILNVYAYNKGMKEKLTELKGEVDKSTIIRDDFNIAHSVIEPVDRKSARI